MPSFSSTAVPADDFRIGYLEEARECQRASNSILKKYPDDWHSIPEFWANLLGVVANATIAAVSDNVALGLHLKDEKRREENQRIRNLLDEKLGGK